jgi:hypothetical protein
LEKVREWGRAEKQEESPDETEQRRKESAPDGAAGKSRR